MRKVTIILLSCLFSVSFYSFGANTKELLIRLYPLFDGTTLVLDSVYCNGLNHDTTRITQIKFYLSSFKFIHSNKTVFEELNSYHLVDCSDETSQLIKLIIPSELVFDELRFNLGIDSLTQMKGAMGGDLDPTKGMYWTWQSGYINFKLEGNSNKCPTRKHSFQFHLGGYAFHDNALQTVQLMPDPFDNSIMIGFDLFDFLNGIDLAHQNLVMLPGNEAIQLSKAISNLFKMLKQ